MKRLTLIIVGFLAFAEVFAQEAGFKWAGQVGGTNNVAGTSIATDVEGNIYTTGIFTGTTDFDPGSGTFNLTANGTDIFIQKLDSTGNFIWAKQIGGTSMDYGISLTVDGIGNVYTIGIFHGAVDFDPGNGTYNLTTNGGQDIFILKLDSNGNFIWAKQIIGSLYDMGYSITTDINGNVYATGLFSGIADFDPRTGTYNLTTNGAEDIFILKLDKNGNFIWAKHMGGNIYDTGRSITTDINGNVYTIGDFKDTVDFDPGNGTYILTSNGNNDIFIQKLDSNGNFIWTRQMGGLSGDYGNSIITNSIGEIYTSGYFSETVYFDPGNGTYNLTSNGGCDIFIQKLDSTGNFIWAKQMGGINADVGASIDIDTKKNIYTTGYFRDTVDFNPGSGTYKLSSNGNSDIFIQKLDSAGNFIWAKQMGGIYADAGCSIDIDTKNNIYTIGRFKDTVDFDPGNNTFNLVSNGFDDIFIQKLKPCYPTNSTDVISACDSYTWIDSVTYTSNNNTATNTLTSVSGCDSIVTLNLTILNSTSSVETITACDNYFWPIDNNTYTISGIYTDTLINSDGCDSIITLNLTIINVDTSFTVNDPLITANTTGAAYQWLDCNNNYAPISGATSQTFTASVNGNYAVEITENGCTDTSACVTISTAGIKANENTEQIKIYPNPGEGLFSIDIGNLTNVSITLTDMKGNLIFEKNNIRENNIQLEINEAKGIYLLEVRNDDFVRYYKVINN